jgi:spore coat polysaccharide biosynthesis protein SpsF (cytidylyltransferase family)
MTMSRSLALIQARMSSTRLPGKVMAPLRGQPLILFMAGRVAQSRHLDGMVIVTSTDPSDDELAEAVAAADIPIFRGDLNDVLKRYADAAAQYEADEIVRLTGDCPLIDPAIIDAVIDARRAASADYSSNVDPPMYPNGLDVECFTRDVLERAHRTAASQPEREHVTLWMRSAAAGLRRVNLRALADLSHLRLTVDYPRDLEVVRRIAEREQDGRSLDLFDILRVLWSEPGITALEGDRAPPQA